MKRLIVCLISALLLSSCLWEEPANDELEMYVERFLSYADAHGYNFRDEDHAVKVSFDDLDENKAGVCYMDTHHPIIIKFDSAYWRKISGNTNSDCLKENLVFHELGHGLLRRLHDNTVLDNGDWKSIMCGDELPDDRSSNINYRGMRRDYYIDELFDRHTEAPKWSYYVPDFSDQPFQRIYHPDLMSETSPFVSGSTSSFTTACGAEGFSITNTSSSDGLYAFNFTDFDTSEDFLLEMTLSSTAKEYGIVVGQCNPKSGNYNGHYVYLDTDRHCFVGELSCSFPFIDLYNSDISTSVNKVGIRRHADTLFYYINDQYFYLNDLNGLPQGGGYVCLSMAKRSKTVIRDFVIRHDSPTRRAGTCTIEELPCPPLRKSPYDR